MMKVDTVHYEDCSVVEIAIENGREAQLTDEEWKKVANNQHRLRWINGHGRAELPNTIRGKNAPRGTSVKRDKSRVLVRFPLEE